MKEVDQDKEQFVNQFVFEIQPKRMEDHSLQFTTALVHELRNPLTNILLSIEQLNDRMGNNVDDKMCLDIILRASTRINSLIDGLMRSKESDSGQQFEYSVHHLLDEVLEMARDRINLKDITVSKDYERQDCKAIMNEPEMKIALTNIIVNAIDAMAPHDGQLSVITRAVTGTNKFVLEIKDNGCGINKKNLENLFISHFTTKRVGLGFGLAATYDILHSNHVGVSVESQEGNGTCFRLLFDKSSS